MTLAHSQAWLDEAWRHLGTTETAGKRSNPKILALYRDAGHPDIANDEVAWCAAFVGACLARANFKPTGSLLARSYLAWGEPLETPRLGAIAVFSRGSNAALGHVGFLIGQIDNDLLVLGGNQADTVSVAAYPRARLLGLRWPASNQSEAPRSIFDVALAHVLAMEGGWTDDPHDPGGPTHRGITLSTYAAWRRTTVTLDTYASLKAELRRLDLPATSAIYRARYWEPSGAATMPAPLALFHFDASVNHGVTGAKRLLQEALGVTIDGIIGAETEAAIRARPLSTTLARYAAARKTKYRSLKHFWRFGRGWLNRVDKTSAAALALQAPAPSATSIPSLPSHKDFTMTPMPTDTAPKWWGNSMTIWGTVITGLSTVLPVLGKFIGLDITADMVLTFGESVTSLIQAVAGLVGTALAIWGRARATAPLTRRPVSLSL